MQPLHDGRLCSTDMYFVGGSSQPTYNPPPWEALHAESAHPKAAQHFFLSTRSSRPKRPILAPVLLAPISGLVPGLIRPTEVPRWGLLVLRSISTLTSGSRETRESCLAFFLEDWIELVWLRSLPIYSAFLGGGFLKAWDQINLVAADANCACVPTVWSKW